MLIQARSHITSTVSPSPLMDSPFQPSLCGREKWSASARSADGGRRPWCPFPTKDPRNRSKRQSSPRGRSKSSFLSSIISYLSAIFQRVAPLGTTINGNFVVEAFKKFLTAKARKRLDLMDACLYWEEPVHTSRVVKTFLRRRPSRSFPIHFTPPAWH